MAPSPRPVPRGLFAGLATLDVVHHVGEAPAADAKATAHRQDVGAGGPAAVAALAFAALAAHGAGGDALLLTALGGPVGRLVGADLAGSGVGLLDASADGTGWMPPVSAVRVSPAGRSVTSPDAAAAPTLVPPRFGRQPFDVVHLDGHHAVLARAAAEHAALVGAPLLVDLGRWKPVFDEVLPHADVVIAAADHAGALEALLARGPAAVAVTAGAGPIVWGTASGERGEVAVTPVDAVDTLGAGDVLHGAVAFALARDGLTAVVEDFPDVLAWASQVAAVRVTTLGPHTWRTDPRLTDLARGRPAGHGGGPEASLPGQ